MTRGTTSRRSKRWLTLGLLAGLVGGLLVWILVGPGRKQPHREASSGPYYTPITAGQEAEAKEIASKSQALKTLVAGGQMEVGILEPWVNSAGNRLLGAVVHVRVRPSVRLRRRKVPVFVTPGPDAPRRTPSLERYVLMSGTGVSELNASVLLDKRKVVAVEPSGRHMAITEVHLVGPSLGPAYRRPEGE